MTCKGDRKSVPGMGKVGFHTHPLICLAAGCPDTQKILKNGPVIYPIPCAADAGIFKSAMLRFWQVLCQGNKDNFR